MPFKLCLIHFIIKFFLVFLDCMTWLTAPPVRKSPPSSQLSLNAVLRETSNITIYLREQYISIYINITLYYQIHNECSELNLSNIQNQNSDLQKQKRWHCQLNSNRLFSFFALTFTLRCLLWKRSCFPTWACNSSLLVL